MAEAMVRLLCLGAAGAAGLGAAGFGTALTLGAAAFRTLGAALTAATGAFDATVLDTVFTAALLLEAALDTGLLLEDSAVTCFTGALLELASVEDTLAAVLLDSALLAFVLED